MRKRMIEETIYKYDELSYTAKEKVRQFYLDGQWPEIFTDDCEEFLRCEFPNSDLSVSYSLGYCQGDYFAITGTLHLSDVWENINRSEFSDKEIKFINWVLGCGKFDSVFKIETYWRGHGSDYSGILDQLKLDIEAWDFKNIRWKTLEKFTDAVIDYMYAWETKFKQDGYNFFYEIEDDELEEWCDIHEYEFYEDGSVA